MYGLGSMAPKTMLGDITLHRPLLEIPKQRLIATLEAAGWEWFEDPSNDSNKQMRGRLRKIMPLFSNEGLTVKRIASTAKRMRRTADALNHAVEQLRNVALTKHSSGPVRLELEPIGNAPEEIALRLISYVISEMGGKSYVARLNRVENLYQNLFNSNTEEFNGSTIGGTIVLVSKSRPDVIWIAREFGRGIKSLSLAAGQKSIWDDRFEIELTTNAPENVEVSQLFDKREQLNGIVNYPDGWPKRAFYSSPVISWSGKMRENSIQPEATCEFFVQGFGHEVPDWLKLRSVNKWLVDLN